MVQNAGVGALLRSRREELGQDTESVSRQLRIRSIYIRAIEEGRLQDLPGTAYAVGFVRTYADFLGFDGNSVVANYRDELGQRGRPDSVSWQIEEKGGSFPLGRLLIVLVVVAVAAYGIWYYLANTQSGSGLIEAVPEYLKKSTSTDKTAAPASGAATEPAPAGQPSSANPSGSSETAPASPATEGQTTSGSSSTGAASTETTSQPATGEAAQNSAAAPASPSTASPTEPPTPNSTEAATQAVTQPTPAPTQPSTTQPGTTPSTTAGQTAASAQTATTAPGSEATPDVAAAAASSTTRISVRAKLESWVQITDKDGKPVMSRVLRAGETYAVPDEKGLMMNTGNAGGIEVMVDGKTLPTLGSVGLVKRNIVLDPDKLAAGITTTKAPGKTEPADGSAPAVVPSGD